MYVYKGMPEGQRHALQTKRRVRKLALKGGLAHNPFLYAYMYISVCTVYITPLRALEGDARLGGLVSFARLALAASRRVLWLASGCAYSRNSSFFSSSFFCPFFPSFFLKQGRLALSLG